MLNKRKMLKISRHSEKSRQNPLLFYPIRFFAVTKIERENGLTKKKFIFNI